MRFTTILAAILVASTSFVHGWVNDCKGSWRTLGEGECAWALNTIVDTQWYKGGTQFSRLECFLEYRTGSFGDQPILGSVIRNVTEQILAFCPDNKGSWGTGNCDTCRVTVNFRDQGCARKWHIAAGTRFWPPWPFNKNKDD